MLADTAGGKQHLLPILLKSQQEPIKPPPPAVEPEPSKLPELEKNLGVAQAVKPLNVKQPIKPMLHWQRPRGRLDKRIQLCQPTKLRCGADAELNQMNVELDQVRSAGDKITNRISGATGELDALKIVKQANKKEQRTKEKALNQKRSQLAALEGSGSPEIELEKTGEAELQNQANMADREKMKIDNMS